jgi:hypothetical protein
MPRKGYNCYKVVVESRYKPGTFESCRVKSKALRATYAIGERTIAPVGYLFTFSNLASAKAFFHEWEGFMVHPKLFKAKGYKKTKRPIFTMWCGSSFDQISGMWDEFFKGRPTHPFWSQLAPAGTVGYKEVELVEQIQI